MEFIGLLRDQVKANELAIAEKSPADKQWRYVAMFTGTSSKNTEPFTVTSNRWRLVWKSQLTQTAHTTAVAANDSNGDAFALFGGTVVSDEDPKQDDQEIGTKIGAGSDSTEMRGAGTWRLKINSANVEWSVTIQEYK
jgi:hypothetical protein